MISLPSMRRGRQMRPDLVIEEIKRVLVLYAADGGVIAHLEAALPKPRLHPYRLVLLTSNGRLGAVAFKTLAGAKRRVELHRSSRNVTRWRIDYVFNNTVTVEEGPL